MKPTDSNIILHGTWVPEGKFCFWGESFRANKPLKKRINKKTPEHPFCASGEGVKDVIMALGFNHGYARGYLTLHLPCSGNVPQSSTSSALDGVKNIFQWKVPCIAISPHEAIIGLARLPLGEDYGPKFSTDISFWSTTAKFALELIARQRFIPSVAESDGKLYARWLPVFYHADDIKRFNTLCESMPPVCGSHATEFSPNELIMGFLNTAIDETTRLWFKDKLESAVTWQTMVMNKDLFGLWFSALSSGSGEIKGTKHQIKTLKSGFNRWASSIKTHEKAFRTCFRLEEPDEDDENWRISFHLQSVEDPSLFVSADKLWCMPTLKPLHKLEHPHEYLLEDLAKAARLFPPVEESLKTKRPMRCDVDAHEAYGFLKKDAWLLEECGYGIQIPSWWSKRGAAAEVGVRMSASPPGPGTPAAKAFFGLHGIIDFNWEIALGDESLSMDELEKLAKLKIPLVNVRGKWIEFKKDKIEDALKILTKLEKDGMTLSEAMRISSGIEDIGIPVKEFNARGHLKNLVGKSQFHKIKTPSGFNGKLRPYQMRGFSWLSFLANMGIGACLADDMGLGKTIQVISLLLHEKDAGEKTPVVIIAPMSVLGNWHHEFSRFSPELRVMVHHGADRLSGKGFIKEVKKHDVVLTTYALAVRDMGDFCKIRWRGVILDEAQNIKNPNTKQAKAICGLKGGYKIALTGTPIENRLTELWSIMEFLNPGYLGSLNGFIRKFSIPIERYKDKNASEKLKNSVNPFILRRLKTDKTIISDLPKKMEMNTYCTLTVEQTTLYKAVVDDMMQKIEESGGIERRGLVLSTLTKLKQICNHPALFLHDGSAIEERSGKLARLEEMLEEIIASGERALVFTQYSEMGSMLKDYLESLHGREIFFLHGGVSKKKRDGMITLFQEDENAPPVFILSVKAGGFGLNLTRANHVFHFDRWWNPAVENQATDRVFRIGQQKNVQVHKFITEGTLEEKIDDMIGTKKGLSDAILSAGESRLTELSNDKLREMFSLREEY